MDTALSFFVTAAHLPEWIKSPAYKKSLQQQEIIVQICDELANRGKHGRSDRQKPAVLHTKYDAYVERGYIEPGYYKETLRVTLTLDAAKKLGMESQVIDAPTLATRVVEFWKAHSAFKGGEARE
jgi:hypothetical protein